MAQQMQTALLNGATIAMDDLVGATNATTQILMALGVSRRKRGAAQ
jgi:hypothetical protein